MSATSVHTIITRAVEEPEYRALLFREPALAFTGYELTEAEITVLQALQREAFDDSAAELGVRAAQAARGGAWSGAGSLAILPPPETSP
jgi:hypothetical protein